MLWDDGTPYQVLKVKNLVGLDSCELPTQGWTHS